MEKQYCRVGAVTPITADGPIVALLEAYYRSFVEKAAQYADSDSIDFFRIKAARIKKTLEALVN